LASTSDKERKKMAQDEATERMRDAESELFDNPGLDLSDTRLRELGKILFGEYFQLDSVPDVQVLKRMRGFELVMGKGYKYYTHCPQYQKFLKQTKQFTGEAKYETEESFKEAFREVTDAMLQWDARASFDAVLARNADEGNDQGAAVDDDEDLEGDFQAVLDTLTYFEAADRQ
jgi:hypothetical protein